MKVLCIDGTTDVNSPLPVDVIEGEIYTVISSKEIQMELWYTLEERSRFDIYLSTGFIPLSDIDETEMIRESLKQTV